VLFTKLSVDLSTLFSSV